MLSDIVTAISNAASANSKTFLFGSISEDLNKISTSASELVFLQIPFNGGADQMLLRHGSGNIGFSMDLYVFEKYTSTERATTTKQSVWDTAMNTLLTVVNSACTADRNLQRSIVGNQIHSEFERFGSAQYIGVRMTLNFSQYWKCS